MTAKTDVVTVCERCGHPGPSWQFNTHHKDRNRSNNSPENLECLCIPCHRAEHKPNGGAPKDTVFQLRLDSEQKSYWEEQAQERGLSLAAFIRQCVKDVLGVERKLEKLEQEEQRQSIARTALPQAVCRTPKGAWCKAHGKVH